nr:hypothetical protein [Vicinamibacterales bacterium]
SGSFDTFVLVANPNGFDVNVEVAFYLEGGGRYTMPVKRIGAGRRLTIDMNMPNATWPGMSAQDVIDLKGKSFAVKVTSVTPNGPVIVEQAVYRNWDPANYWRAGSSAFGVAR